MKIRHPLLVRFAGLTATTAIRGWMSTIDYRVAYYDPTVDPVVSRQRRLRAHLQRNDEALAPPPREFP